jgi:hypothetical protein
LLDWDRDPRAVRATRLSEWLAFWWVFRADVVFEVFVEVLPNGAERFFIVLQAADQQRAFE